MSLFKEKDDLIKQAFQHFNSDDEDDEEAAARMDASSISCNSNRSDKPTVDKSTSKADIKIDQHEASVGCSNEDIISDSSDIDNSCENQESDISCIDLDSDDECITVPSAGKKGSTPRQMHQDEVISISSDDDHDDTNAKAQLSLHNTSIEDYDFTLKLTMAGIYRQYQTTYRASLADTLKPLLDDLKTKDKGLKLFCNDLPISLDKSPSTLALKPGTILHAIEIPLALGSATNECDKQEDTVEDNDAQSNTLTLKLQDGNRKHTKDFRIKSSEPLCKLKSDYARALNLDASVKIKLLFDGDQIDDESTAEDLDIEDGFALDVLYE